MKIILIQGPPGSDKKKIHDYIVNFLRTICKKQVAELHMGEALKNIAFKNTDSSGAFINETIRKGGSVGMETTVPIWKKTLTTLNPNADWVVITGALRSTLEVDQFLLSVSEMKQFKKVFFFELGLPIDVCKANLEKREQHEVLINNKISFFQKTTTNTIKYFNNHGKRYPFVFCKKINMYQNKLILLDIVTGISKRKKCITIAGDNCSSKSSVAKIIAAKLGIRAFSSGDYARSIASGAGVSIEKACATAMEEKPSVQNFDDRIDDWVTNFNSEEYFVMDSRLAFLLIPKSFKVRLELDAKIASEWVWEDPKRREAEKSQNKISTCEEFQYLIEQRLKHDVARYQARNGINITDRKHYDFVINVKNYKNEREKIVELVLQGYCKWLVG